MTYTTAQGRQQLLDSIAQAIDDLGLALAALGEAYEQLDERSAETLEGELFRPVQAAYGRAQRTYTEFAARHDLPRRTFAPASPGHPSQGVKGFLESAGGAGGGARADRHHPEPRTRAGAQVRSLRAPPRARARVGARAAGSIRRTSDPRTRPRSPPSQSIPSGPSAEPLRNCRTKRFSEENIFSASPASTMRPRQSSAMNSPMRRAEAMSWVTTM